MWGRLGPRFAVEAAFLILLAVGLGLADEDWVVIVAVMAAGWALVSLIELVASRRAAVPWPAERVQPTEPAAVEEAAPVGPPHEEPAESPPVEEAAAPVEAPPGPLPEPVAAEAAAAPREDTVELRPGALDEAEAEPEAVPRRRWFRRRKAEPEALAEEQAANGTVDAPKHVRKLEPDEAEGGAEPDAEARAAAESAEGH